MVLIMPTPQKSSGRRGKTPPPAKGVVKPKKTEKRANMPEVLGIRGNVVYIGGRPSPKVFNPWLMGITLVLILVGGLSGAVAAAQITNTEREINAARNLRTHYQGLNVTLREQVSDRYTNYEIERIASERLGMARPDPSQVIEIYVPRHSYVVLNTADYIMPQENYFLQEIMTFLTGITNRIFGG